MRRRFGIVMTVVTLALGGVAVASSAPAGAAAVHTVTVTPSTGLSDGQTVTVTGAGFDETPAINDWFAMQCSGAILAAPIDLNTAINDCNVSAAPVFVHADPAGNLSTSLVVHTTITIGLGGGTSTATCGQAPNDCAILVSQLVNTPTGGVLIAAAAPISFGAAPTPTLGDCIRTFLGDHQHSLRYRFHHLLVCIFTALAHKHG